MIDDAAAFPNNHTVESEFCVVGSGPVGISLALDLAKKGRRVVLLEAGSMKRAQEVKFFAGERTTPKHPPVDTYRNCVLGGTSATWGGRCVQFDPIDFQQRDYVAHSGWPFGFDVVQAYYPQALALCDAGGPAMTAETAFHAPLRPMIPGFESDVVTTTNLERFSLPTHFGKKFRDHLSQSDRVQTVINATCVDIRLNESKNAVDHVVCKTPGGGSFRVKARHFILATGGIEVTRLLLGSDSQVLGGIGNSSGILGKYYMTHVGGVFGDVKLVGSPDDILYDYERDDEGIYCRRRMRISDRAQREFGISNTMCFLHYFDPAFPEHRDPILSGMYIVKKFLMYEYVRRLRLADVSRTQLLAHWRNVLSHPIRVGLFLPHWFYNRRILRRKLPSLILRSAENRYSLYVNAEQVPNPNSRITLVDDRDEFGQRRVKVDWQTTAQDGESMVKAFSLLQQEFARTRVAELTFDADHIRSSLDPVGGHFIGTTRMSPNPAEGVVDADLRLHDVANLFVASSSVFPTSSHANPTLTMIALALRMGDHLHQIAPQ